MISKSAFASAFRKLLSSGTLAASLAFATSAYAQRTGNQFDPGAQKRILREFTGPTALCQEVRSTLECREKFPEHTVMAAGTALMTAASLQSSITGAGADVFPRLVKFAAHFGFAGEEARNCMIAALRQAEESRGNGFEHLANANYKMQCRGWQSQIDLIITLTPKSSF